MRAMTRAAAVPFSTVLSLAATALLASQLTFCPLSAEAQPAAATRSAVASGSSATQCNQSAPARAEVTVLIAYASRTGATEAMAQAVEVGAARVPATHVVRKRVDTVTTDDLLGAHAIILGSPVHNGGIASEVKAFIDRWPFGRLQDKVGAAFVAAGATSSGEELAMMDLLASMMIYRFVLCGGEQSESAFGASTITVEGKPTAVQGKADEAGLAKARALGERVARVTRALADGGWPTRR
jgi:NAD(P)H dehydrogenase (quinone)